MKSDEVYLRHILDAVAHVEQFMGGLGKSEFIGNPLVHSAVIRQLEIIGEAVKNLSFALRKSHKNIAWRDIAGLRDKLIHEYFGVDLSLVWIIAVRDIPQLKLVVERILKKD